MRRLMISAARSGSGKTAVTCGLLAALRKRGLSVDAFKCGPDYIDPMFHSQLLGRPCRNLDLFLQGEEGVRRTLARQTADLALLEGAMGFYDGLGGTDAASAWRVAGAAECPVLLVVRPRGTSLTLAAEIRGLLSFREPSRICALLLNDCKPMLAAHLTELLERETGLPVVGYLPPMEEARLESRHLGLMTAAEVEGFHARFAAIADQLERTADLTRLISLSSETASLPPASGPRPAPRCKIAVARDDAFCFCYADDLDALEEAGAELVYFSPLRDGAVPPEADGLYLVGGYPELHAQALSENVSMRESVREAVAGGMPTVAECGGFLYLQQTLEDDRGRVWPMAGALAGQGFRTDRLQRFGYVMLAAEEDGMLLRRGEAVPAHEFHYWDCTDNGASLTARKPGRDRSWRCGFTGPDLYASFPHLHFGGALPLAERFTDRAAQFHRRRRS